MKYTYPYTSMCQTILNIIVQSDNNENTGHEL